MAQLIASTVVENPKKAWVLSSRVSECLNRIFRSWTREDTFRCSFHELQNATFECLVFTGFKGHRFMHTAQVFVCAYSTWMDRSVTTSEEVWHGFLKALLVTSTESKTLGVIASFRISCTFLYFGVLLLLSLVEPLEWILTLDSHAKASERLCGANLYC